MDKARTNERSSARGGFTLVELMVAIAILLIFGAMAVTTLRYGAGMWRDGHRRSYAYDTATVIFQQVQDDLSAARNQFWGTDQDAFDTRVKFWTDFDALNDAGGNLLARRQWMRFVRGIPDFSVNPAIRQAGTDPTATGWYNLVDQNPLQPLEGMCEVAYMMGLGGGSNPNTLYRAVLAPIGRQPSGGAPQPGNAEGWSFFNSDAWANYPTVDTTNDALATPLRLVGDATHMQKALPLAQNVLYFGIRLWGQYTTVWDPSLPGYAAADEATTPFRSWLNSYTPDASGTLYSWDSDRLDVAGTPLFPMDWNQPGFVPPSAAYATNDTVVDDNVFPRAVMVVVTVEPPPELAAPNPMRLSGPVDNVVTTIPVVGNPLALNAEWPYVKVDDEWMRVTDGFDLGDGALSVVRGVRRTAAQPHNTGALAQVGYTFSRVFNNPAVREDW